MLSVTPPNRTRALTNLLVFNTLRITKAKNPGDTYYEEYIKHWTREGTKFFDQYHYAIMKVIQKRPARILEIGVRTGSSICNMLSAYINYNDIKRIVLIDIWNDTFSSPELVKINLKLLNIPAEVISKIEFKRADSRKEVPKLQGEFDYILVDGDHSKETAIKDLEAVVRLCAQGGVIVFDDISEYGCNLKDVWDDFKAKHTGEFKFEENIKGKGVGWAIKL